VLCLCFPILPSPPLLGPLLVLQGQPAMSLPPESPPEEGISPAALLAHMAASLSMPVLCDTEGRVGPLCLAYLRMAPSRYE
jgi:hypothetical protein